MATLIEQTKKWIEQIVIDLNLCPFAKTVFDKDVIHYKIVESNSSDDHLIGLFDELKLLKKVGPKTMATSMVLFPSGVNDFESFLDLFAKAEFILEESKMDQTFQLAGFHPNYQFEGTQPEDIGNATNQSPYPMIHILRVNQVTKAINSYDDIESIPTNNIKTLEALGKEKLDELKFK